MKIIRQVLLDPLSNFWPKIGPKSQLAGKLFAKFAKFSTFAFTMSEAEDSRPPLSEEAKLPDLHNDLSYMDSDIGTKAFRACSKGKIHNKGRPMEP